MQLYFRESASAFPIGLSHLPEIAEQIGHCGRPEEIGRAERQPADCPELLLKLAGQTGIECQMAGVVRPWRNLIDQKITALRFEKLDANHSHNIQLLQHRTSNFNRPTFRIMQEGYRRNCK